MIFFFIDGDCFLIRPRNTHDVKIENIIEEDEIYYQLNLKNEDNYLIIFKILKNYIETGIIFLGIENYYFLYNFEIITKFSKICQQKMHNYLIILNQIDLSSVKEKDLEKCKSLFCKYFPKFKTFNLNLNTIIPFSTLKICHELLMNNSFTHLINYIFFDYLERIKHEKALENPLKISFIDHLKEVIKAIKLKKDDIKSKIKDLNNSKDISKINEQIKTIIKDIEIKYKDIEINLEIKEEGILNNEDSINEDDDNYINSLNPFDILKIIYILQKEKIYMPSLSYEANSLLNYFKIETHCLQKIKSISEEQKKIIYDKLIDDIINNDLQKFNTLLKSLEIDGKIIENYLMKNNEFTNALKYSRHIIIPFLGESNIGKSTIINGIIGKQILDSGKDRETTKKIIIIRYSEEDEPFLEKVNLLEKENYNEFETYEISRGENKVKETLKCLNNEFSKEEDFFYILNIKIKLFDEMEISKFNKDKIYLVELPNLPLLKEAKDIFRRFFKIFPNSQYFFNIIVRNFITRELMDIISIINNKLSRTIIKSSLFINNDYSLSTDIDKLKGNIFNTINDINKKEDINVCLFNALSFLFYRYYHNYFFDVNQLIETEFLNFIENKNKIYIFPEISIKVRSTFLGHLYWTLSEKAKQLFNKRIDKNQTIKENILVGLKNKLNEIKKKNCENIDLSSKFVTQIGQMISYAQDNLMNSYLLKQSNIDELKKIYCSQLNNLFEKPNKNIDNIYNIIKDYETFLTNNIENIHKDIINSFSKKVENIIK